MYVCVPLFVVINVADDAEAARAKAAIQQLLQHDMVNYALSSSGVQIQQTTVGDPYACEAPKQPQQKQSQFNGRR